MKTILAFGLLSALAAADLATAQGPPEIGIFFDPNGQVTHKAVDSLGSLNVYVLARNFTGLHVFEGALTGMDDWSFQGVEFANNSPNFGTDYNFRVVAGACVSGSMDWTVLVQYHFMWLGPEPPSEDTFYLTAFTPSSYSPPAPGFRTCSDIPVPFEYAEEDGFLNDRVVVYSSDNPCLPWLNLAPELVDGGFETQQPGLVPTTYGQWGGDLSAVVGAEQGITPHSGSEMLKFIATQATGPSASAIGCDIFQLVSLCQFDNSSGDVDATLRARFNRVAGDGDTDREFVLQLSAYAGSPADFDGTGALVGVFSSVDSDSDPGSWEQGTVSITIPAQADYLALRVNAREDVFDDATDPEFDGHYVDDVSLVIGSPTSVPVQSNIAHSLGPSYPNPFGAETTIALDLARAGQVDLRVFDLRGRLIRTLASRPMRQQRHLLVWDGRDEGGRRVAAGTYFYRLETEDFRDTKKVVLLR